MLKKNIYIILETQVRELDSQLLFSVFAINRGYRVYIGSKYSLYNLIRRKKGKAGIYLVKGGILNEDYLLVSNKCDKHVVLDQEIPPGFHNNDYYKTLIKARYISEDVKYIDRYYCADNQIQKNAQKTLFKGKKAVVTGWPRIDLFKNQFKILYEKKII